MIKKLDRFFENIFSEKMRNKVESTIIYVAILGFIVHLLLIALVRFKIIMDNGHSYLLDSPIAAIYTPFSFIIIYEVYLLVYYLPKSTTIYIAKQYEIITLIIIRRVFKDLSNLEITKDWVNNSRDTQLLLDLITTLLLFFLIFVFYSLSHTQQKKGVLQTETSPKILRFIQIKKIVAASLIPVFLVLSFYSFGTWLADSFLSVNLLVDNMKNVNKIFFNDFFTILILIDVLLLLFSLLHTDEFHKIIRNSGFIISTILIKLSFNAEGILNLILIIVAVLFGVSILLIHNKYEKSDFITEKK